MMVKNSDTGGGEKYWELPCTIITFEIFFFKGWEIHQPVANFLDYFFMHVKILNSEYF